MTNKRYMTRKALPKRSALAVALAVGMGVSGFAFAQATTGTIFGSTTAKSAQTVKVVSNSGLTRTVSVNNGRYSIGSLPIGVYTVTLQRNGETVGTRNNVHVAAGSGVDVDFAASQQAQNLAGVSVVASAMPSIDVSSVSSSTIITAAQLKRLPVAQSAEGIALLSPTVVRGSPKYGNAVSFGGAGQTENAYYVNGYNTTEPFNNQGGFGLPYGVILQQKTSTGGYTAKYGRSDGGVISQVGKSGTNQWHYGGRISWEPAAARANAEDQYYPVLGKLPAGYSPLHPELQGKMYRNNAGSSQWSTVYSAYIGGPLIENKLYFFVAGEVTRTKYTSVGSRGGYVSHGSDNGNNVYAKINWNINENNTFQFTRWTSKDDTGAGSTYNYDYDTFTEGAFHARNNTTRRENTFNIFQYTSYLSDNATLDILYGRGDYKHPVKYATTSELPYINAGPGSQNYLDPGEVVRRNGQTATRIISPDRESKTRGLRVDFTYQLGEHQLGIGIDNMWFQGHDEGQNTSGPGYQWVYSNESTTAPISTGLDVGIPSNKYVVDKNIYNVESSMSMYQKAWYIQDRWQVTDNFLLSLGLRNDRFVNNNGAGQAFVDQSNQWEPRIGFSWDIMGDSSMRLYGNMGRYYLALPDSMAERSINRSTNTDEYFTYTGIDANGAPVGLTCVKKISDASQCAGPVSANNELGQVKDVNVVTAKGLKSMYQDEYILGFDMKLGEQWVWGVKAMYRDLGNSIDDTCFLADPTKNVIAKKLAAKGLDPAKYEFDSPGCRVFNPGADNTYAVKSKIDGSYTNVTVSPGDRGANIADWQMGPKRDYYAINLYLQHTFNGKWQGRIDYTFSKLWGNTEGQTRSDAGQTDVSKTMDWDFPILMAGSNGYLSNQRRHVVKIRGAYQLNPEWTFSGTLVAASGMPKACLGLAYLNGAPADPVGYGQFYRYCAGKIAPRGTNGFEPWTKKLNIGIHYKPAFADHKLEVSLDIYNALNEQTPVNNAAYPIYEVAPKLVYQYWGMPGSRTSPRYMRLQVSYNY